MNGLRPKAKTIGAPISPVRPLPHWRYGSQRRLVVSYDQDTKKHWFGELWGGPDTELARPVYVANLEKKVARLTAIANDPKASLVKEFGDKMTYEQQVPIIDQSVNNVEGQFQVNVPNRGAITGMPDDVVVEVPAVINKKGIQPCASVLYRP